MSKKYISHALFIAVLFASSIVYGQRFSEETFQEKLVQYAGSHPSGLLYVHTDKTVYTNNETIWFSGYLIQTEGSSSKDHTILSVALMREDNRKIVLENKYLMESGLSAGSLTLPDTIPPGNYQFIGTTNVVDNKGQPLAVFTRPLTLKSITQPNFTATLSLLDTVAAYGAVRAQINVAVNDPDPRERITIDYAVGRHKRQSVTLKKEERSYTVTIPGDQLSQFQPSLLTTIKYGRNIQHLSIRLPEVKPQGIHVRFFPEGGSLVAGLESIIGFEAKTAQGLPVALTGILYRDNQPIDTLATASYGTGSFRLKPDHSSSYSLKIAANPYQVRDTSYQLPRALPSGITLNLAESVVRDTLQLLLNSSQPQDVQILIHNYRQHYALIAVKVQPSGKHLSVALGPLIPKGLATITILDPQNRPLAERLFFAHYDQGVTTSVLADKQTYNRKEKVNVKLKLTGKAGRPLQGIMSIAVVQDNRVEGSKLQDIESYVYLTHDLGTLPQNPQGRPVTSKEYLEDMLLIKGWRRYTWQSMMNGPASDTALQIHTLAIKGQVRYTDKLLKKPVELVSLRDTVLKLITTESDGAFILSPDHSLTTEGRHVFLSVNKKIKEGYTISIDNPFMQIHKQLSEKVEVPTIGVAHYIQNTSDQQLRGMERVIALQAVTITATGGDGLLYNACGDYVCRFNILNCPNHYGAYDNHAPIKGRVYSDGNRARALSGKLSQVIYKGCTGESNIIFKISGIYTAREFYGVAADAAGMLEPQFLSTLYWKPGVMPDSNGETEFSFFTGNITGKFRIIVQGVGTEDMIYGENSFMVK